jgi:hypothetical protein
MKKIAEFAAGDIQEEEHAINKKLSFCHHL